MNIITKYGTLGRRLGQVLVGLAASGIAFDWAGELRGQVRRVQLQAPRQVLGAIAVDPPQEKAGEFDTDKATLKTDADLEASMAKAERYLQDQNYRIACRIWQEVLNRCGDTLFSTDGEIYYSLSREIERMIGQLPPEGLRTYRITADATATEILAAANEDGRVAALNRITSELFLSSLGDDAAFELAARSLDAWDFVGASRLLQRISDAYPEPSVPMDQVWLRLALCRAQNGDTAGATAALEQARQQPPTNAALAQQVAAVVEQLARGEAAPTAPRGPVGGPGSRLAASPPLPSDYLQVDLWPQLMFKMSPSHQPTDGSGATPLLGTAAIGDAARAIATDDAEQALWNRWTSENQIPVGQLLFEQGRAYFRTAIDLTVWDTDPLTAQVVWRPAWLNHFEMDESTRTRRVLQEAYGNRGRTNPQGQELADVFFFGDRIAHAMSIYRRTLYVVEGQNYDISDRARPAENRNDFQWGRAPRRTRKNYLTAYDAQSGHLQWRVPAYVPESNNPRPQTPPEEPGEAETEDVGFMGPALGFGDLLLVPVNVAGSIYVYALDPQREGALVWRSYLTDEPSGGANPWAPIYMSIEGSDLYVVCGCGALFILDPGSGVVRFARRYPRTGKPDNSLRNTGVAANLKQLDGFWEDTAIAHGRAVLVLASDLNMLRAYDRQDGRMLWEAPLETETDLHVKYLIGIHNDILYAGGTGEVIAYDLNGDGRMLWNASWTAREALKGKVLTGQACLTSEGVYLPLQDSILQLDLKTGSRVAQVGVRLPPGMPVGNLYSDGRRLWVVSANRLMALEPAVEAAVDETAPPRGETGGADDAPSLPHPAGAAAAVPAEDAHARDTDAASRISAFLSTRK